ncbi:hypothetical protein ACOMHN_048875 [Nucella lapillus]
MSSNLMIENGDDTSLTSVPLVLSADSHVTHILTLAGNNQLADSTYDAEDLPPSSSNIIHSGDAGEFPMLFQTSSGCQINLLPSVSDVKSEMTLLNPVHKTKRTSTLPPLTLSKDASFDKETITTADAPLKSLTSLQLSHELQGVRRNSSESSVVLASGTLTLTDALDGKALGLTQMAAAVKMENTVVSPGSVSLLKGASGASAIPLSLSEVGEAFDMEPTPVEKTPTILPERAVLVETPQGLMLSVGDELRAVTVMEDPDSQGSHILSISSNGIPVALLSQCQQEGMLEDQEGGETYQAGGERGVGADGSVLSTDLSINTQQVLSTSPQDVEPKRKNRGWPKGKRRKPVPQFTGPRAPMTGYVLFAINRRQEIKQSHPDLLFSEVTKMLGQEWSTMPMDRKQKFLDEAENDKQRYIDELKQLQKSEMYQSLVKKRRTNDDAKDDTDNEIEDSDELHCRVCDLYFSSLHNKKEHLLGKQHLQAITDQLKQGMKKQQKEQEGELQESLAAVDVGDQGDNSGLFLSPDSNGASTNHQCSCWAKPVNVSEAISDFVHRVLERDQEIFRLRRLMQKHCDDKLTCYTQLQELKDYERKLQQELRNLSAHSSLLTDSIHTLKMVPALFGVEEFS